MAIIIGIGAPPGGGKSSLAKVLANKLPSAVVIDFDHYQSFTQYSMNDIVHWLRTDADVNYFEIPHLVEDLTLLKRGQPIRNIRTNGYIEAKELIILETHFGKAHQASGQLIDLFTWIETPLDIALARNIHDITAGFLDEDEGSIPRSKVQWLHGYVDNYLSAIREMLILQEEKIGCSADCRLDGTTSLDQMAEIVLQKIQERFGESVLPGK